ncbi:MAG: cation-translocating P-type ATPase C-terminal domain-containing protein [Merdibacter sp.]
MHLLFINLITDSLPALAIGMERSSGDVLKDKPRDPSAGILNGVNDPYAGHAGHPDRDRDDHRVRARHGRNDATAQTMAFAVLCLSRLFHGFNCRSEYSLKHIGLTSNRYSIAAFFAGAALLAIILLVPQLHTLFSVTVLNAQQLLTIVGLAVIPTIIIQTAKMIREASAR